MIEQQPLPTPNNRPIIQRLVMDDLQERLNHGIEVYGTGLQVGNGRDTIRDAYEEAQDLTVYLKAMQEMRKEVVTVLLHVRTLHSDSCGGVESCHICADIDRILHLLGWQRKNVD